MPSSNAAVLPSYVDESETLPSTLPGPVADEEPPHETAAAAASTDAKENTPRFL
jgi:hypothetical protein